MDKKEIRAVMLEKRKHLQNKKKQDAKILNHVLRYAKNYKTIAIFHAFEDEINTHPMIEGLLKQNKTLACPKIENGVMQFIKVTSLNDFKKGYFEIYEPIGNEIIKPEAFDLIFVPLLAFNDDLYRIGYGGGFYDRFLAQTSANKVGLAYTINYIDVKFQEIYDIKLDHILTEKGFVL